jgi:hypothetical protein
LTGGGKNSEADKKQTDSSLTHGIDPPWAKIFLEKIVAVITA